jgi:hypothetical protein
MPTINTKIALDVQQRTQLQSLQQLAEKCQCRNYPFPSTLCHILTPNPRRHNVIGSPILHMGPENLNPGRGRQFVFTYEHSDSTDHVTPCMQQWDNKK